MDGSQIAMARTAVTHAVRLLKPADQSPVVCYDDQIDTVLERTQRATKPRHGSSSAWPTNLSGGWLPGAHQL